VSTVAVDPNVLRAVNGFLVADVRGRVIGRVERASSGDATSNGDGGRLTVRRGVILRRRQVVPVSAIDEIDTTSGVIALRVEREALRRR
jgi:hypothetical protein